MKSIFKLFVLILPCFFSLPLPAQEKIPDEMIKRFISCFEARKVTESEKQKATDACADPPCFKQPITTTIKEYLVICYFPAYYRNPLRECFSNQRIIAGSVQMFNLEHLPRIRRINDRMLNQESTPLIPEYLKHPFPKAEKECCFASLGDITSASGLFIYCAYHGSAQSAEDLERIPLN